MPPKLEIVIDPPEISSISSLAFLALSASSDSSTFSSFIDFFSQFWEHFGNEKTQLAEASKNVGSLQDFLGARSAPEKLALWIYRKKHWQ